MQNVPPHFHRTDRINEKDLIPNDEVLSVAPDFPAPEGKEYVVDDGVDIRTYRMIRGVWRYQNWT